MHHSVVVEEEMGSKIKVSDNMKQSESYTMYNYAQCKVTFTSSSPPFWVMMPSDIPENGFCFISSHKNI